MTTPKKDSTNKSVYYQRKDGDIQPVNIPNILIPISEGYIAIHSSSILYISKNNDEAKVMCIDGRSHYVSSDIEAIIKKLSLLPSLVPISNAIIINKKYIKHCKRGNKLEVELINGEEFDVEVTLFDQLLS